MMLKKLAFLGAAAAVASSAFAGATANLVKTRLAKSADVVPGRWHASLSKARSYAVANGVPLIAVWSNGDACPHCVTFEKAVMASAFTSWMKTSGCVFSFVHSGDSDGKQGGAVYNWHYKSQNVFPFVRVYWPKGSVNIYTKGDTVDGGASGATGGKKAVAYFKDKLKKFKPGTTATPAVVKPYTIEFDPNGATNEMPSVSAKVGTALALPANAFIRPDYAFNGWATTTNGAAAYKNKATVKNLTTVSNGVVTLYATWVQTVYRGYSAGVKTTIAISDCKGWTRTSGSVTGMKWSSSTGKWTGTPTVAKTYAIKYKKGSTVKTRKIVVAPGVPYSIAFAPNGATNEMASVDAAYGVALALPANAFVRPDYAFNGWAKTSSGSVAYKNKASVKNLAAVSNKVVTLYAKWLRTTYRTYFTGVKATITISDCKGWTKKSGAISGMSWNQSAGKWTGTPKKAGTYTIKYKKGSSTKTRKIVVVKDAIVFADEDAARYVSAAGEPVELGLAPSSIAGTAKTVSISGLPAGLGYDLATGCVTGTSERVGTFKATVTVTSAKGQKLSRSFNVTIGVPDCCIGAFNGFIGRRRQDSSDPFAFDNRGMFQMSAPSNANLSAKIVTAKGTYSLGGRGWIVNDDGTYTADLATADGAGMLLFTVSGGSVSTDFVSYGAFSASYGAEYEVWAQRSPFERDEAGGYADSLVAGNIDKFAGTWHFAAYAGPSGEWTLGFAEQEKNAALTLKVADDGTATLAGKIGSCAVSVSSTVFVFEENVENGFVRADFAVPVSVTSGKTTVKKTLNIWMKLWFDRANGHYSTPGDGIGAATLEDFE